jgi:hypothetical protein
VRQFVSIALAVAVGIVLAVVALQALDLIGDDKGTTVTVEEQTVEDRCEGVAPWMSPTDDC